MTSYEPSYCPYCGEGLTAVPGSGGVCESCDELVRKQPVVAAHTIVVDGKSVLVTRRAAGRNQGSWAFPGGHLEVGEHPAETARRELDEETSLDVDADRLSLQTVLEERNPDGSVYLDFAYRCSRDDVSGELQLDDELAAAAFVSPAELATRPLFRDADPDHARTAVREHR